MAIDPIGQDSYNGLGVPLEGESVIRQQNSSNAILTLMHSSVGNTGRILLGVDYKSDRNSSLLTDLAVFDIDEEGGFRSVSGTTVKMELNTSGLYAGTTQVVNTDGVIQTGVRGLVTTVAAATTGLAVSSAASGTLYVISTQNSTMQITLPATPMVGSYFDFFGDTTNAGDYTFMTAATGDDQGFVFYVSTGVFASTAGVTYATTGIMYFRFTALTSGSLWAVASLWYSDETTNIYGSPAAGSTST